MHRGYVSVPQMVKAAGGAIWAPIFDSIDEQAIKTAQAQGLQVMP